MKRELYLRKTFIYIEILLLIITVLTYLLGLTIDTSILTNRQRIEYVGWFNTPLYLFVVVFLLFGYLSVIKDKPQYMMLQYQNRTEAFTNKILGSIIFFIIGYILFFILTKANAMIFSHINPFYPWSFPDLRFMLVHYQFLFSFTFLFYFYTIFELVGTMNFVKIKSIPIYLGTAIVIMITSLFLFILMVSETIGGYIVLYGVIILIHIIKYQLIRRSEY